MKCDGVLRVLRGEDLQLVSRDIGTTAAELSRWRDSFLEAGAASLNSPLKKALMTVFYSSANQTAAM